MAFQILLLFFVAISTYICYKWIQTAKYRELARKVPGPPKLWLLGNLFDLARTNEENTRVTFFEWPKKYGKRSQISFLWHYFFVSWDPSDLEKLLSSMAHINKGYEYEFIRPWLGNGLLTSQGSKWATRRKMLTPSFHFKILEQFVDVFNAQSYTLLDNARKESMKANGSFDICPLITRCTLDIICETAMGKKIGAQHNQNSDYVEAIYGLSALLTYRANRFWLHSPFIWNLTKSGRQEKKYLATLHGFTDRVIKERKVELQSVFEKGETMATLDDMGSESVFMGKKKRVMAFLDLLLEYQYSNPDEMSDLDIREETDTFMFEGHDTTSASLSWTIYLLGCYPEHQKKVQEELDLIFGDDKTRDVNQQDLTKMKYLEACIKESLRLYPSVPFVARMLNTDLVLDDGLVVPKGCNVAVLTLAVHQNADIYPNPSQFQPERFFPENAAGRHPYAYIPFSAGPRNCIGQKFALMEEKIILAHFFRNFSCISRDMPSEIVLMTEVITRSKHGLHVTVTSRTS